MGLFDLFKEKKPERDPLNGGADGFFDVLDGDGRLVRYAPDDFDEIWTTADEREAGRHVSLGWILLDELVVRGDGPGREVLVTRPTSNGEGLAVRTVPINVGPDDVTTYVLGYLKPGRNGSPVGPLGTGAPGS
jgi:hypothetical protein